MATSKREGLVDARTKSLHESEQRFKDFAETVGDRFLETDAKFQMSYCSPPVGRLKLPADKYMGKPLWEIPLGDTDTQRWIEFRSLLEAKKSFRDFHIERHFDDAPTLYLRFSGIANYSEDGDFTGYRCSAVDVSNEVAERSEAASLEKRLFDAMDSLDVGLILWDRNDRLAHTNKYVKVQHLGDGYSIALHQDITELRQIGQSYKNEMLRAESANRSKTEFLASMSHDLRTPLKLIFLPTAVEITNDQNASRQTELFH